MTTLPTPLLSLDARQQARREADPFSPHRKCEECCLYTRCRSPFMRGRGGPGKIRILFVAEAPRADEDIQDKPFAGKVGQTLLNYLKVLRIPVEECWVTSAVACRVPNDDLDAYQKQTGRNVVAACQGGIRAEIQAIDPDIVVLFGNTALTAVLGLAKISTWQGKVIWSDQVQDAASLAEPYKDSRVRAYLPSYALGSAFRKKPEFVRGVREAMAKLRKLYLCEVPKTNPFPPVKVLAPPDCPVKPVSPGPAPVLPPEIAEAMERAGQVLEGKADAEKSALEVKVMTPGKCAIVHVSVKQAAEASKAEKLRTAQENYLKSAFESYKKEKADWRARMEAYKVELAEFPAKLQEWQRQRDRMFVRAKRYLRALRCRPITAYDYETPSLDQYQPGFRLLCVGFAPLKLRTERNAGIGHGADTPWLMPRFGVSIPLFHFQTPWTTTQLAELVELYKEWLSDPETRKLAQNHPFEFVCSVMTLGVEPAGHLEDTRSMSYVTDENKNSHGLKQMAEKDTPYGGYEERQKAALRKVNGVWALIPLWDLCPYNGADAFVTAYLKLVFYPRIVEEQQEWVLENILDPALRLLARMELEGIMIAIETVADMDNRFSLRTVEIDLELAGTEEVVQTTNAIYEQKAVKSTVKDREDAYDMARAYLTDLHGKLKAQRDDPEAQKKPKGGRITLYERTKREVETAIERVERLRVQFENAVTRVAAEAEFNPGSDDHVRVLLFEVMQLPVVKWTDGGDSGIRKPSVDDEVLEKYKSRRICRLLKERRKYKKLKSTYLTKILPDPERKDPLIKPDGCLHPGVSPIGARTGRLSSGGKNRGKSGESSDSFSFNIQNLARPFKLGCDEHRPYPKPPDQCEACYESEVISIRKCFQTKYVCLEHRPTARDGCTKCGRIVMRDYAQLEFMIAGILAKDEAVLACIERQTEVERLKNKKAELQELQEKTVAKTGSSSTDLVTHIVALDTEIKEKAPYADIHKISAAGAFGVTPPEVTKDQRQDAKSAVSFGLLYRRTAPEVAKDFGKSLSWALAFCRNFSETYWGIDAMHDDTLNFAHKYEYVLAPQGRKRRLEEINSPSDEDRTHAENAAVNFAIQSWASDCTLLSAIEIDQIFRDLKMVARVVCLVHDAIYVDCPYEEVKRVAKIMKKVMEAVPLAFEFMTHPIRSDLKIAVTMAEADD